MKTIFLGAVALALLGSPAFAQRYDRDFRDGPRYGRDWEPRHRDWEPRRLHEGGTVPYEYRQGGHYIYYDWRDAGLRRPPRGFEWMLIDNQFLLADQHTGYILDVRRARNIRY